MWSHSPLMLGRVGGPDGLGPEAHELRVLLGRAGFLEIAHGHFSAFWQHVRLLERDGAVHPERNRCIGTKIALYSTPQHRPVRCAIYDLTDTPYVSGCCMQ